MTTTQIKKWFQTKRTEIKQGEYNNAYPGDNETLKNKWKVNPKLYEEEMKKLSAKIGVKLQILYDKCWCEMISIEKKILETSNSLEIVDKEVEKYLQNFEKKYCSM